MVTATFSSMARSIAPHIVRAQALPKHMHIPSLGIGSCGQRSVKYFCTTGKQGADVSGEEARSIAIVFGCFLMCYPLGLVGKQIAGWVDERTIANSQREDRKDAPRALLLFADPKSDPRRVLVGSVSNSLELYQLSKQYYLIKRTVSNVNEAAEAISSTYRMHSRMDMLVIFYAHGSTDSVELGPNDSCYGNEEVLHTALSSIPALTIVFHACLAGSPRGPAQQLSQNLPNAKVYGSMETIGGTKITRNPETGDIVVEMKEYTLAERTHLAVLPKLKLARCYQNGKPCAIPKKTL